MIIDMTKNSTNECYGLYTLYFKVQVNHMEIGCRINCKLYPDIDLPKKSVVETVNLCVELCLNWTADAEMPVKSS